jgi:hypothetical protein
MEPTIGRIVHFVGWDARHHAAIVTEVWDGGPGIGIDSISLAIFERSGVQMRDRVYVDEGGTRPGSWHWPERD